MWIDDDDVWVALLFVLIADIVCLVGFIWLRYVLKVIRRAGIRHMKAEKGDPGFWKVVEMPLLTDPEMEKPSMGFARQIVLSVYPLELKKIAVFGFQPVELEDLHLNASVIFVAVLLTQCRGLVHVFDDGMTRDEFIAEFGQHGITVDRSRLCKANDPVGAARGAYALVVLSELPGVTSTCFKRYYAVMASSPYLYDFTGKLNAREMRNIGFHYMRGGGVSENPVASFQQQNDIQEHTEDAIESSINPFSRKPPDRGEKKLPPDRGEKRPLFSDM